ncbi:hypothetical protein LTR78_007719 [Recurvomyces mirabilis]|uniref:Uncharacterized protein n=1 Tax=Recurvomyces mirabilis TaxID=574656 RepID=A0AAE0TRD2_9PEZI|nr:hypothetical protein LTR78_007719 [Recurvomyces mirabilis]KAK5151606.1 hypothetical protein LTS14_009093 [Recurvomyces mirabilis]
MTTPSPSEFLTFSHRLTTSLLYRSRPVSRLPIRQFTASTVSRADTGSGNIVSDKGTQQAPKSGNETGGSREHALDKGNKNDPNIQSYESSAGRAERANDSGGNTTRQKDERNSTEKAKKDHPEAPDVVIGMQDERGGKGA